ncbi:uncharacterized protein [Haliotis cracherodii]|uniref:uncharacterized protein n=1 Tax=Haliotis cracherodii TaxID=6455 RepID=UPI0039E9AEF3
MSKSGLYRRRRKTTPALPRSLTRVDLPDTLKTTDGQRFLCIDDGQDDRILCFATDLNFRYLQQLTSLYMDGTFYSCPALWDQLYVIHGLIGTKMTQFVFCVLPNRRRKTYARLFDRFKVVVQEVTNHPLAPETIQTDFEAAAIRAEEDSSPNTDIRGCFSHSTQSIWKKVQQLEMVNQYRDNPEVKKDGPVTST